MSGPGRGTRLIPEMRAVEWVFVVFFLYSSALALLLPVAFEIRVRTLIVNAAVFGVYALLSLPEDSRHARWAAMTRNWYALALPLLAYKQMGWFAPSIHTFQLEQQWVVLDRIILSEWGIKSLIETGGNAIPFLLELSYLLVYAVGPVGLALLYTLERREHIDKFLLVYVLGLVISYSQFPFWPSEPPRTVFPGDLEAADNPLRRFNLLIVGTAGIHTSVFPSAHVSGVLAAALALRKALKHNRRIRAALFIYSVLVAVSAFYGRYHYAVDVFAGVAVAFAAAGLGYALTSRGIVFSEARSLTADPQTTVSVL